MASFPKKLEQLLLRRGLSQRGLATQLRGLGIKITQRAISGWAAGAKPRPEMLATLAQFFDVTVEVLGDDQKDLPPAPNVEGLKAGVSEAIISHPLRRKSRPEFEQYLDFIRRCRKEAESVGRGDEQWTRKIFEDLLATWMASPGSGAKSSTAYESALRQVLKEQKERAQSSFPKTQEGAG